MKRNFSKGGGVNLFIGSLIIGIILALILGGKLANLGALPINRYYLPLMAFLLQGILGWARSNEILVLTENGPFIHLFSYILIIWWLWENRFIKGSSLLALGVLSNLLVIGANGGFMPVDGTLVSEEFLPFLANKEDGIHSLLTDETKFALLADIIYLPFPQPSLISIGDIFLALGLFWISFYYTRFKADNKFKVDNQFKEETLVKEV